MMAGWPEEVNDSAPDRGSLTGPPRAVFYLLARTKGSRRMDEDVKKDTRSGVLEAGREDGGTGGLVPCGEPADVLFHDIVLEREV